MFPEYSDQIAQLKAVDPEFLRLCDQHAALAQKIRNMETRIEPGTHEQIEILKKQKLLIKDSAYVILKRETAAKA
jgi:uncharacterized protein YdcH (DUF465 family)